MKKCILLSLCLASIFIFGGWKTTQRPNVIVILSDDQGYGDLASTGNPWVETPHLDKMASQSAVFDRFYVSPLCAPTRASLLSGRYHLQTGVLSVSNGLEIMNSNEYTLAELLKDNGYKTGIFGKWHNGQHLPNHPNGQGFDEFFGFCAGHLSNYFDSDLMQNQEEVPTKGYITDVLTDKALAFITKNKNKPFFCYIPYNAPHSPYQVPDKYFNKYKAKGLNNELSAVYGMVDNMDENIGRIFDRLSQLQLDDNTIVIFMTDNGPNGQRYNTNMKGTKSSVNEGGIRVPCFVKWSGKIKPGLVKTRGAHIDILPTIADLCGLKNTKSKKIDGISLKKAIFDANAIDSKRFIFSHVSPPIKSLKMYPGAMSDGDYKLVVNEKNYEWYDLKNDPSQTQNIVTSHQTKAKEWFDIYKNWFETATAQFEFNKTTQISPLAKRIELPTYESTFNGQLRFKEGHGWAHDYLVNWVSQQDSIYWEVDNPKLQKLRVIVRYTLPQSSNAKLCLHWNKSSALQTTLLPTGTEVLTDSPDLFDRKEVEEKKWAKQVMGTIQLPKGRFKLILKANNLSANEVFAEIKSLVLRPVKN